MKTFDFSKVIFFYNLGEFELPGNFLKIAIFRIPSNENLGIIRTRAAGSITVL